MGKKLAKTQNICEATGLCLQERGMVSPCQTTARLVTSLQGPGPGPVRGGPVRGGQSAGRGTAPSSSLHGRRQQQTPPGWVSTVGASQPSVFCSSWSANSTGFPSTWCHHKPAVSSVQWHKEQTIPLSCKTAHPPPAWREHAATVVSRAHFPAAGPVQACCYKRQTGSSPQNHPDLSPLHASRQQTLRPLLLPVASDVKQQRLI